MTERNGQVSVVITVPVPRIEPVSNGCEPFRLESQQLADIVLAEDPTTVLHTMNGQPRVERERPIDGNIAAANVTAIEIARLHGIFRHWAAHCQSPNTIDLLLYCYHNVHVGSSQQVSRRRLPFGSE
jgi:hypothetical protein